MAPTNEHDRRVLVPRHSARAGRPRCSRSWPVRGRQGGRRPSHAWWTPSSAGCHARGDRDRRPRCFIAWIAWSPPITPLSASASAVAVLIIPCPCAMGLARPPPSWSATAVKGAEQGVLIRGGDVLERAASVTTVVLDKTGTITRECRGDGGGVPETKDMGPGGGRRSRPSGRSAKAETGAEARNRAPLRAGHCARAAPRRRRRTPAPAGATRSSGRPTLGLRQLGTRATPRPRHAGDRALSTARDSASRGRTARQCRDRRPPRAAAFEAIPGRGVRATVDGRQVVVGSEALMRESRVDIGVGRPGRGTSTALGLDDHVRRVHSGGAGIIALADNATPGGAMGIARLHAMGKRRRGRWRPGRTSGAHHRQGEGDQTVRSARGVAVLPAGKARRRALHEGDRHRGRDHQRPRRAQGIGIDPGRAASLLEGRCHRPDARPSQRRGRRHRALRPDAAHHRADPSGRSSTTCWHRSRQRLLPGGPAGSGEGR